MHYDLSPKRTSALGKQLEFPLACLPHQSLRPAYTTGGRDICSDKAAGEGIEMYTLELDSLFQFGITKCRTITAGGLLKVTTSSSYNIASLKGLIGYVQTQPIQCLYVQSPCTIISSMTNNEHYRHLQLECLVTMNTLFCVVKSWLG